MVRRAESPVYASTSNSAVSQVPVLTHSSGHAVARMTAAFADRNPAIVLVSRWPQNAKFMVDLFLEVLPDDVAVARVTEPCNGAASTLRSILIAFGVKQTHLNINVLEEELERVLVRQMNYCRRPLICFEAEDDIEPWVLDRVRRLMALEERDKFGLTVIVSGGPKLRDRLTKPPFDEIAAKAGQAIVSGPLTLEETRDYITRQVRAAGVSNVYQVFDFAAMTAIHEFSDGLTDRVDALCHECIELSDSEDKRPITPAMVRRASEQLEKGEPATARNGKTAAAARVDSGGAVGRLVAQRNGSVLHQAVVNDRNILIGRAEISDIPLTSTIVSRHHAMVVTMQSGVGVVDLGSTNGTFVDGKRIEQHVLQDGEEIRVGDCTITFFAETG